MSSYMLHLFSKIKRMPLNLNMNHLRIKKNVPSFYIFKLNACKNIKFNSPSTIKYYQFTGLHFRDNCTELIPLFPPYIHDSLQL